VLQAKMQNLSDHMEEWRAEKSTKLAVQIQKRIYELQNPKNCSETRKFVCNLDINCGFGCLMHHAVFCFIVALKFNRTVILISEKWQYGSPGLSEYFRPVSDDCTSTSSGDKTAYWESCKSLLIIFLAQIVC
jgi:glycoprotein 6-alpha-L-fucosyltransferase